MAQQPLVCQGLLIIEGSWSQSVGLLWTSDQPDAETCTWQHTTLTTDINAPAGFELTIPASERPQTHDLDRATNVIGILIHLCIYI